MWVAALELLKRDFLGWLRGERDHCKMVAIPTLAQEDAKRPNRERESLIGEQSRIVNRMKAALARLGIRGFKTWSAGSSAVKSGTSRGPAWAPGDGPHVMVRLLAHPAQENAPVGTGRSVPGASALISALASIAWSGLA
jgi:hypothetical protein